MASFIDLVKFNNILKENKIELFDYDIRISHYRLCNWVEKNNKQLGGSLNNSNNSIKKKIKKMSQIHLTHFVCSLLNNNEQKINWILSIY